MTATLRRETRSMLVDIENVTGGSVDENGFLQVTVDVPGEQGSTPHEVHHIGGLWYWPLDPVTDPNSGEPDPSQSGQALTLDEGGTAHALLLSNPKTIQTLPIGVKGETILFNDFGAFARLDEDGTISLSTTTDGGAPSGQTVFQQVTKSSFVRLAPWGRETFDQTGWRLAHIGGGVLKLGTAGGIFPGLSSYFRATADMIEFNGAAIQIGPTGSVIQPVAQAVPLVSILGTIATAFQTLQQALLLITAGSPTTGGAPASAACAPAFEAVAAAVASALATISTQTAIG